MRIRRLWPTLLLLAVGCSTHPIADTLDTLKPGHLYPDARVPYGGVCIPQGPGVTGTTPAIPPPPVVPPAAPLPPGGVGVPPPSFPG